MHITRVEAYACNLDVERQRSDAIQTFTKQETIFVDIHTEDGVVGTGYTYTIGTGGRAILEHLQRDLLDLLIGEDAAQVEHLWQRLFWANHSTMVGPITSLALAAIDTALWDLRGKATGQPLWLLAGGHRQAVPIYDTEGGWLDLSPDEVASNARRAIASGFSGVKLKVGKANAADDLDRLQAVREAIGRRAHLMVDANQSFTSAEARRRARLFEAVDVFWLEEPLPAEDIDGHVHLASSTSIPIAIGESLYAISHFREYLQRGAAGVVQPDVARIGGITPWLKVAHLAESFNVKVAPHFLMELHVSLGAAIPNCLYVEYIPQLRSITEAELTIRDGCAVAPSAPGLGIAWDREKIAWLRQQQEPAPRVAVGR